MREETSTVDKAAARPPRHLRVTVTLGEGSARVSQVWLVDEAAVHRPPSAHPIAVVVEVGGRTVTVETHPDPRTSRSTVQRGRGHHYGTRREGTLTLSVPFEAAADLATLHVGVADLSGVDVPRLDADTILDLVEHPVKGMEPVHRFALEDLRRTSDWVQVASDLGLPARPGSFEIYADRAGEFRWRLRRPDGEVVADSGEGYRTRAECEADLQWVRANAATAAVVSLDLPRPDPSD